MTPSRREEPFELVRVVGDITQADPNAQLALEKAVAYFMFYERRHPLPEYLDRVTALVREGAVTGDEFFESRLMYGRALRESDSLLAAERVLEELVADYPDNAYAHYRLGMTRKDGGHLRLAREDLAAAWRIQPAFIEAGIALADVAGAMGDTQEAIRVLKEVLRRNPVHHPGGWNNLGFAYLQERQLTEAEHAFKTALQLDPDLAVALVNLGSVYLLQQQWDAAIEVLARATEVQPDYAAAWGNLGVAFARAGQPDRARDALEEVLRINPNDRRARALLQELQTNND